MRGIWTRRVAAAFAMTLIGATGLQAKDGPGWLGDGPGIQLWSFNTLLNKGAPSPVPNIDIPSALSRIRKMGVRQVEMIDVPGYSPSAMRTALDRSHVKAVSLLLSYDRMKDDLPAAIEEAKTLGVSQVGIEAIKIFGPAGYHLLTIPDTEEAGAVLSKACVSARAAGLKVFLHIHGNDLHDLDGETALDRIIHRADGCFDIEADVYWIRSTGMDPVAFIKKYGSRVQTLHLKDWKPPVGTKLPFPPLGQGQLDLPAILAAARAAGTRHYIIEDESGAPDVQLPQSLNYLEKIAHE